MKIVQKDRGFLEHQRHACEYESVADRVQHYKEFEKTLTEDKAQKQATRCMDCGVPFCQGDTGCPVDNLIPEFNELVFRGLWEEALQCLHSTNNFPEFTGRLCPAPCETACVLGIIEQPVAIKSLERAIIDRGFAEAWIRPIPPREHTGRKIAIVGSGPAGLACAQQLARSGHSPTVFEKHDRIGGLLRYGIPDFKMEKWHIDRRLEQMEQEGVLFKTGHCVGVEVSATELLSEYDALVLAIGAEAPIPLDIPGRDLPGVHYAMEYLIQSNRAVAGDRLSDQIDAKNHHVIVIGGGDTGSDCIGTANRQQAKQIINFRRSLQPPTERPPTQPWPFYPDIFYTSTSHEEGVDRRFCIRPLEFVADDQGCLNGLKICRTQKKGQTFVDVAGSQELWPADLVFLAMGYRGPTRAGLVEELMQQGLELDSSGNITASFGSTPSANSKNFRTSLEQVYCCGDARRGQSLIVWAISEGRKCAAQIHHDLMNT